MPTELQWCVLRTWQFAEPQWERHLKPRSIRPKKAIKYQLSNGKRGVMGDINTFIEHVHIQIIDIRE